MHYEFYFKQALQKVELNLNKINFENLHLINALDKSINPPSIR